MGKNKIYAIGKDNKAITLISLIVTIMVLLILAGVATFSGIEAINNTKYTKFKAELKIMQSHVNKWYEQLQPKEEETFEENIASKFNNVNATNANGNTEEAIKAKNTLNTVGISNYSDYYLLKDTQKQQLGIEGVEQDVLVSVKDRKVVSYEGLQYKNNTYYTLDDLNEVYNVDYTAQEGNPLFRVSYTYNKNSDLYNINIDNINYDGPISKWNVKYKLTGEDSWNISKELKFTIKKCGKYEFKLFNGDVETEELGKQEVMIIPVENIQDNYYLIMMNNTKPNFTGCTNVGTIEEFRDILNAGNFNYDIAYVIEDINIGGTEENQWTPIGTSSNPFTKIFDGQSYTIDGVYIKGDKEYQGLFRNSSGTIKNINANNFYIDISAGTGTRSAGIVGYNEGTVENCVLSNSEIKANGSCIGGMAGYNYGGIIKDCINKSKVSSTGNYSIGGIAGINRNYATINNSKNHGEINANMNGGGIAGTSDNNSSIINCNNDGKVECKTLDVSKNSCAGGICGENNSNSIVKESNNKGIVIANSSMLGGITGYCNRSIIESCINYNELNGIIYVGGISGHSSASSRIENSCNFGNITSQSNVNGNSGGIQKVSRVGGIIGSCASSNIKNCYNKGRILGNGIQIGGIAGNNNSSSVIENCYNDGDIATTSLDISGAADQIGGIAGANLTSSIIKKCYNKKSVIGGKNANVGGIVGLCGYQEGKGNVENCYNVGNVSSNKVVAGIAGGLANGSITNCYNIGQITSNATLKGAITSYWGTTQGSRDISNCYYLTGTCEGGINSADEAGKAESRTASQMKEDAFVTLLNVNTDVWQKDSKSVNSGYPVFK